MSDDQEYLDDREYVRLQLSDSTVGLVMNKYITEIYPVEWRKLCAERLALLREQEEDYGGIPEYGVLLRIYEFCLGGTEEVSVGEALRVLADGEEEPSGSPQNLFEHSWEVAVGTLQVVAHREFELYWRKFFYQKFWT